jgi:hypothetical protein
MVGIFLWWVGFERQSCRLFLDICNLARPRESHEIHWLVLFMILIVFTLSFGWYRL